MAIDPEQLRATFLSECVDNLEILETALLALEADPQARERVDEAFRAAHSIKGGAGTFGEPELAEATHALETALDLIRDSRIRPTPDVVTRLLAGFDALVARVERARSGEPADPDVEPELRSLDRLATQAEDGPGGETEPERGGEAGGGCGARTVEVRFTPEPHLLQAGLDPLLLLRDVVELGAVVELELDPSSIPPLEQLDPTGAHMGWRVRIDTERTADEIEQVFLFVEGDGRWTVEEPGEPEQPGVEDAADAADPAPDIGENRPAQSGSGGGSPASGGSLRVATEKIDELIAVAGELSIAQSIVSEVAASRDPERFDELIEALETLEQNSRAVQEQAMAIGMVPIGTVFRRFPRLVRDVGGSLGKSVRLDTSGEDIELDKSVIDRLADPLTHLVRNALDHGIEAPADRAQAGKPEAAALRLHAYHEDGGVVIEIQDDGRGIDPDSVRTRAESSGLIAAGQPLTDDEVLRLVFAPGFSTAETVSDLSGRGVGMDVVRRAIEELGGQVRLESSVGEGTTVRLKLPLTLAIMDGLSVRVGEQVFVLPLLSIQESIRPEPDEVKTIKGRGEVVLIRGEPVSLVRLHRVLGIPGATTAPTDSVLVLADVGTRRVALQVDELLGQSQVVVRSLEENYGPVPGVMGATVLGDGRVALIADAPAIQALAARDRTSIAAGALPVEFNAYRERAS